MYRALLPLLLAPSVLLAAIGPTAQWDVRANAAPVSATYGGGFYTSGGTDYSQQDAPQLELTDVATTTTTTLTSATGGFTAAMVGNGLYLEEDAEWYEVATYVDTNEITVDRATNDTGAARTIAVGGAVPLAAPVLAAWVPGNTLHIKADATHTVAADLPISVSGALGAPLTIEGYDSTHGDAPTGDDRPLVDMATYYIGSTTADFINIRNLRITGSAANIIFWDDAAYITNVSIASTNAVATSSCMYVDSVCLILNCEVTNPVGRGVYLHNGSSHVVGSYIHDCSVGVYTSQSSNTIANNLITSCYTAGVWLYNSRVASQVYGNTIAQSAIGISVGNTSYGHVVLNNIITACDDGITSGNDYTGLVVSDYNAYYDNDTDVTNWTKGTNALDTDPGLTFTSWSDLACADHAGPPFDLTSAAGGFSAVFSVGDLIKITNTGDTAHFVPGFYRITVVADGQLSLATDPTDGTDETGGEMARVTEWTPGVNMKGAGFPGTLPGSGTTSYTDIGGVQREEPAGGGGVWGSAQ